MKSNKNTKLRTFLIHKLRRISYMWEARKNAQTKARVERGRYKCAHCQGIFGNKEIALDHVVPVVGSEGFIDWNNYIERLFCDEDGFQVLCHPCHTIKTNEENSERKKK